MKELISKHSFLGDELKLLSKFITREISYLKKELKKSRGCVLGLKHLFIDVDGNIFPCENSPTEGIDLKIGSVYEGLNIEKVNEIQNQIDTNNKKCINCWAVRMCTLCQISLGEEYKLTDEACNSFKIKLELCIKIYITSFFNYTHE